ncbi:MAG: hypothetical protein LC799_21705, partial [Actinobacteria bacterium]|nr:hypothetical protein [Actinomycetota bacterium]
PSLGVGGGEAGPATEFGVSLRRRSGQYQPEVVPGILQTDADYLDNPDAVQAYTALWNRLQAAAIGQVESRHLIFRIADEHRQRQG